MSAPPFLLSASPREGNTLAASKIFRAAFNRQAAENGSELPRLRMILLRDCRILPCIACGACERSGAPCPQADGEDGTALFRYFLEAPILALAAPIYFYHLPSTLKALLDRCQFYYRARERGELRTAPRKAFIMLLAARERGERLFQGSLLTLKLALAPFNFNLAAPLLLRGLNGPRDLARREDLRKALIEYGSAAARCADGT
ncbi:MAG: NAD(P)H-dependent oxidoreductase [Deltaproteobacteria bacterium]|jgi:multimeric flavodoxin WrbA|nr:NAD(P)H-dependent oxidoreductase [Deltaproteobacteria bacterium]